MIFFNGDYIFACSNAVLTAAATAAAAAARHRRRSSSSSASGFSPVSVLYLRKKYLNRSGL